MTESVPNKHGGFRPGAGRKKGVKFSNRTEYLGKCITKEEKEYLEKCLEDYRNKKNNNN